MLNLLAFPQKLASSLIDIVQKRLNVSHKVVRSSTASISTPVPPTATFPPAIHTLPSELLLEIFLHYLADDDEVDPHNDFSLPGSFCRRDPWVSSLSSTPSGFANPLLLSQICAQWRVVTLSTPILWSSLAIYRPHTAHLPVVRLWLARSGPISPLSLSIVHAIDVADSMTQTKATVEILHMFAVVESRWQVFRLVFHDRLPLDYFASVVPDASRYCPDETLWPVRVPSCFPILESIHIDFPSWNHDDADRLWNAVFLCSPRLRQVDFGTRYRYKHPFSPCHPFAVIESAPEGTLPSELPSSNISNTWARLTHLTMRQKTTDNLSLDSFLHILGECTALEALNVAMSWPEPVPTGVDTAITNSTTSNSTLTLPNLRNCEINAWKYNSAPLLNRLVFPSLARLRLSHSSRREDNDNHQPRSGGCRYIIAFLERCWMAADADGSVGESEGREMSFGLDTFDLTDRSGRITEEDAKEMVLFLGRLEQRQTHQKRKLGREPPRMTLRRLKLDIEDIGPRIVEVLLKLQPQHYWPQEPPHQPAHVLLFPELASLSLSKISFAAIDDRKMVEMAALRAGTLRTLVLRFGCEYVYGKVTPSASDGLLAILAGTSELDKMKVDIERLAGVRVTLRS